MKLILKRLFNWVNKRKNKKLSQRLTSTRVIEEYQNLINEFRLIQEKKSKLSRSQRDFVELIIKHLISKGHIQANK
jgi:hypothetical protein